MTWALISQLLRQPGCLQPEEVMHWIWCSAFCCCVGWRGWRGSDCVNSMPAFVKHICSTSLCHCVVWRTSSLRCVKCWLWLVVGPCSSDVIMHASIGGPPPLPPPPPASSWIHDVSVCSMLTCCKYAICCCNSICTHVCYSVFHFENSLKLLSTLTGFLSSRSFVILVLLHQTSWLKWNHCVE